MREDGKGWDYAIEEEEEALWHADSKKSRDRVSDLESESQTRDGFEYSDVRDGTTRRQTRARTACVPPLLRIPCSSLRQHGTAFNDY